jgi:hypothetical protein
MTNFDPVVVRDELAARLKGIKQAEADARAAFKKVRPPGATPHR